MRASLFIARDGVELGSLSGADARALLQAGFLKPTDDFWRQGMKDWRPLAELEAEGPKPTQPAWNVRERVRAVAGDAGRLARKLKEVAQSGSISVTKTRERVLEDFLPQLRLLVATRLKQAALNVDATLKDEELMKKVFGAVFDCLPKPVRRFVAEDQFVKFCMKHKEALVGRDETSGNSG
jgi:hypothetical protein